MAEQIGMPSIGSNRPVSMARAPLRVAFCGEQRGILEVKDIFTNH